MGVECRKITEVQHLLAGESQYELSSLSAVPRAHQNRDKLWQYRRLTLAASRRRVQIKSENLGTTLKCAIETFDSASRHRVSVALNLKLQTEREPHDRGHLR